MSVENLFSNMLSGGVKLIETTFEIKDNIIKHNIVNFKK